ncbi:MAG: hypothetical protein OHK0026_09830 [Rhodocyclaceae bacterium]
MMKQPANPKRRKVLAGLGAGGAGVAVALAAGRVPAQAGKEPAQAEAVKGYRLTEHVRSYYRTAGI